MQLDNKTQLRPLDEYITTAYNQYIAKKRTEESVSLANIDKVELLPTHIADRQQCEGSGGIVARVGKG